MRAIPIGDEWIEENDDLVVRSPFDGHEIDRVPACDAKQVDRAVASAIAVHREGTLPAWKRAEILDRAAQLLGERQEEFARTIAEEAAKPIKTARVEARRAVSTFTFAAAVARTAHGRDGAHGRVRRRRGQARLHPAGADRRRRGDQSVQLPAEPRGPQGRTGDRRRLPDGAEAGVADAAVGDRARPPADHGVRAPARAPQHRHRERGERRRPAGRPRRRRHDHLHRLPRGGMVDPSGTRRGRRSAWSSGTTRR